MKNQLLLGDNLSRESILQRKPAGALKFQVSVMGQTEAGVAATAWLSNEFKAAYGAKSTVSITDTLELAAKHLDQEDISARL